MTRRFISILSVACIVLLAGLMPALAQTAVEPRAPTQEELNTPSGDASNAREMMLLARPTITVGGESNWDDGYGALLGAFKTLRGEARRLGLAIVGPPQAIFTHTDDAGFKFEAFLVLNENPDASLKLLNKMKFSASPAGRAFVFQHVGAYDDIDSTYEAITAWLDEKNLSSKGAFVEEYLNEPEGSDDALLKLNIYVFIE